MSQNSSIGKLWGIILAGGEGTRVRPFHQHLCGNRGIKQFCAVIGRRSMLEHTMARVKRLIPPQRMLIVVNRQHRREAAKQLAHWPAENVIFQPVNCETAPGILLPLAYLSHHDPMAIVTVFPSDHFILDEERFVTCLQRAVTETKKWYPEELTLLGITADKAEEGYGWIEPGEVEVDRESRRVKRFWEKPTLIKAQALLKRGAMWNTFVFITQAATLWEMVRQTMPDLHEAFMEIRRALGSPRAEAVIEHVYSTLPTVNFSSAICERASERLRVFPVPEVGWSDWGNVERILKSLDRIGKLEECLARSNNNAGMPRG